MVASLGRFEYWLPLNLERGAGHMLATLLLMGANFMSMDDRTQSSVLHPVP